MLVENLINLVYILLDTLLIFEIPSLPSNVESYMETFFQYLTSAGGILANYTPLGYLVALLAIVIAIEAGIHIYKFVMWVLRKIPMLGIS